jgi:hypothetical protein
MNCRKIIIFALMFNVCHLLNAIENSHYCNLYNINGILIGSMQISQHPEKIQSILLPSSKILSRDGEEIDVPAGMYFIFPNHLTNSPPIPFQRDEFGYEDVTDEYLPLYEWDAGDIEIADMNEDGRNDIVFSILNYDESIDSRPRIWIQTPNGNFIDETDIRIPDLQAPCYDIELFDIDSDNDIDIFLTGYSSSLYYLPAGLLINDGTGVFTDESTERLPQLNYPDFAYFAEAAKLGVNQSIDLIVNVVSEPDSTFYLNILPEIWLNNGNGFFIQDSLGRLPNTDNYGFFELITTDIDNDDLYDIIFANMEIIIYDAYGNVIDTLSGQNACYYNTGDGFFSDETELRMPEEDDPDTRDLAISDIDNDGDLDILEVGLGFNPPSQQVRLLSNDGNGYYSVFYGSLPYLYGWFNDSQFGLLDDDEFPDLFMIRVQLGEPYFDILLKNNGDGTFIDTSSLLPTNLDFSVSCALFDHQNDNDIDILIANTGSSVGEVGQNVLYHNTLNPTSIEDNYNAISNVLKLSQNYPNPFNPTTTITFNLTAEDAEDTELVIYNLKGQKVKTLIAFPNQSSHEATTWQAGLGTRDSVTWDGTDENNQTVSSGIYLYRLKSGNNFSETKRMLLLK